MLPLMFGPPMQPATPIPPQVALAYAVFTAFHIPAAAKTDGEGWQSAPVTKSSAAGATLDAALTVLRQYMTGEHSYKSVSDFASAGLCEWGDLPPNVQNELLKAFPANWRERERNVKQTSDDVVRTHLMAELKASGAIEAMAEMVAAKLAAKKAKSRRARSTTFQQP